MLVVLDGFLLGRFAELEQVAAEWRSSGTEVARRLRGAFTLVVWDEGAQSGAVVCDQFSLRVCLMHGTEGGPLRFSTHLPALRRMLPSDPGPEPAGARAVDSAPVPPDAHDDARRGRAGGRCAAPRAGRQRLASPPVLEARVARRRSRRSREELVEMLRAELRRSLAERLAGGRAGRSDPERRGGLVGRARDRHRAGAAAGPRRVLDCLPGLAALGRGRRGSRPRRAFSACPERASPCGRRERFASRSSSYATPGPCPVGRAAWSSGPASARPRPTGYAYCSTGRAGDEVFGRSPYLLADRLRRADLRGAARAPAGHCAQPRTAALARRRGEASSRLRRPARPCRGAFASAARKVEAPEWLTAASAQVDVRGPQRVAMATRRVRAAVVGVPLLPPERSRRGERPRRAHVGARCALRAALRRAALRRRAGRARADLPARRAVGLPGPAAGPRRRWRAGLPDVGPDEPCARRTSGRSTWI